MTKEKVEEIRARYNAIESMDPAATIDYIEFAKQAHRDRLDLLRYIDSLHAEPTAPRPRLEVMTSDLMPVADRDDWPLRVTVEVVDGPAEPTAPRTPQDIVDSMSAEEQQALWRAVNRQAELNGEQTRTPPCKGGGDCPEPHWCNEEDECLWHRWNK
jgi:hypothetical protein